MSATEGPGFTMDLVWNLQHDEMFGEFARQVSLSGSGWAAEY